MVVFLESLQVLLDKSCSPKVMLMREKYTVCLGERKLESNARITCDQQFGSCVLPKTRFNVLKYCNSLSSTSRMLSCGARRKGARSQVHYPPAPLTLFKAASIKSNEGEIQTPQTFIEHLPHSSYWGKDWTYVISSNPHTILWGMWHYFILKFRKRVLTERKRLAQVNTVRGRAKIHTLACLQVQCSSHHTTAASRNFLNTWNGLPLLLLLTCHSDHLWDWAKRESPRRERDGPGTRRLKFSTSRIPLFPSHLGRAASLSGSISPPCTTQHFQAQ